MTKLAFGRLDVPELITPSKAEPVSPVKGDRRTSSFASTTSSASEKEELCSSAHSSGVHSAMECQSPIQGYHTPVVSPPHGDHLYCKMADDGGQEETEAETSEVTPPVTSDNDVVATSQKDADTEKEAPASSDEVTEDHDRVKSLEEPMDVGDCANDLSEQSAEDVDHDVRGVAEKDGDDVVEEATAKSVIDRCLRALAVCVRRFQHHHRTTYRIAHTYAFLPCHQVPSSSKALFIILIAVHFLFTRSALVSYC